MYATARALSRSPRAARATPCSLSRRNPSPRTPRVSVAIRAASRENDNASEVRQTFEGQVKSMARYDWASAGLPALAVVSVFVANGQDPWKALSIAFCATVVSIVANEFLFDGRCE